VERLGVAGVRVCRIGHPARVLESVLKHSLDSLVRKTESSLLAKGVRSNFSSFFFGSYLSFCLSLRSDILSNREDMDKLLKVYKRTTDRQERAKLRAQLRFYKKDLKDKEHKAAIEVLDHSSVGLHGFFTHSLSVFFFILLFFCLGHCLHQHGRF
jgi:ATP-dependent RNA/DNA helicase IGHMBP2